MMHENLCNFIHEELDELDRKVKANGKLTTSESEYGDMLAHFKKTLLVLENMEGYDGYSSRSYPDGMGGNYVRRDERSYNRGSYARGRMNARRDAMGRYSRADGMEELLGEMRDLLPHLSDEKRRKAERLLDEMERM